MTRVVLKGIKRTSKRLADGSIKEFFYWRGPKCLVPLTGKSGSAEFMAAYNQAAAEMRSAPDGVSMSVISKYKASTEYTGLKPSTKRGYATYINRIKVEFGEMPLAAIEDQRSRGDFLEWRDGMADTPRAADLARAIIKLIMNFGVDRSILKHNPCFKGRRMYKGGKRQEIVWTAEDIRKLGTEASSDVMAAVMLALWTGQRQGDVLRMPWTAYDGHRIRIKQGKTGKDVNIPVIGTFKRFLDALPRTSTQILTSSTGRPWTTDRFQVELLPGLRSRQDRRPPFPRLARNRRHPRWPAARSRRSLDHWTQPPRSDLKSARHSLGLSSREFSRLVGVEQRTVFRWESGEASIPGPLVVLVEAIIASDDVRKHFKVTIKETDHDE